MAIVYIEMNPNSARTITSFKTTVIIQIGFLGFNQCFRITKHLVLPHEIAEEMSDKRLRARSNAPTAASSRPHPSRRRLLWDRLRMQFLRWRRSCGLSTSSFRGDRIGHPAAYKSSRPRQITHLTISPQSSNISYTEWVHLAMTFPALGSAQWFHTFLCFVRINRHGGINIGGTSPSTPASNRSYTQIPL